jgi:preprotein translocase subunit SecD
MKNLFIYMCCMILCIQCKQKQINDTIQLKDGFYQVNNKGVDSTNFGNHQVHEVSIAYNSIYNEQEFTKLLIDTSDFVPLELEQLPSTQKDSLQQMQLSITLSKDAANKIKKFTAQRINKGLAIVLDGEAITMHKVRDTIQGGQMVISFCGENACQQLYTRIKENIKH